jgi:hypothetical protein
MLNVKAHLVTRISRFRVEGLKPGVVRRKAPGEEHPDVAGTLDNMALVYDSQGRYEMGLCRLNQVDP